MSKPKEAEAIFEQPLPHSTDAERSVLGAILVSNRAMIEVAQRLHPEHFFQVSHRNIYAQMSALSAEQKPIDVVPLVDALQVAGKLESVGGAGYISGLMDGVPSVTNVTHYAQIVRDKAVLRGAIRMAHAVQERAFAQEGTPGEVLDHAAHSFLSLMSEDGDRAMTSTWAEAVYGAMNELCAEIRGGDKIFKWQFGIPKIDDLTGGWRLQDLNLIVGMTSHGKSLLAMQGAVQADERWGTGGKGIIFSAEMSQAALAKRELAHTANVPLYQLRRPELIHNPDVAIERLTEAAAIESRRNLVVVDRDITPERVWSLCEMVKWNSGLNFVVVDYDQLVVRAGLGARDDEFRAQAEFMANALALAKRLNLCFILLCQPRKVDEDVARGKRPPRVEQIFGSSAVANTAHNILWIMRKYFTSGMDPMYERSAVSYILKARNDKTGKAEHGFDPDRVLFTDEDGYVPPPEGEKGRGQKRKDKKAQEDGLYGN